MLNDIKEGTLKPCPVCGSTNIDWFGYRYISLRCNDCKFEMYPSDEFSSEYEYFKDWNDLSNIDDIIKRYEDKIQTHEELVKEYSQKKSHFVWTQKRINAAREEISKVQ